ncbi:MAG: NYN domain-containing protein [Vulcanimicrobiota bacterium]
MAAVITPRNDEANLALFIDFDNLAIGVRQSGYDKFDIHLLMKRLLEKGRILFRRAYCDWSNFPEYKRPFHEAAIEMFDIPQRSIGGKNSADIRMVVDALDLCYTRPHIDLFVIASGDSDFSPLVSKLRENNKRVIGVGVKNSTSDLLVDNCDEFVFYEDLIRGRRVTHHLDNLPKKKQELFSLLEDAVQALQRQNKEILWSSMVKQMMKRLRPTFDMDYFGYRTFSKLLEDAEKHKVVNIERDERSGSYIILDLGEYAPGA